MNINNQKIESWMFREKNEFVALFLTLAIVLSLGILAFQTNFWLSLGALVIGFLYIKLQQAQLIGNALAVNALQFNDLYKVFTRHVESLNLKKVNLYIIQDPTPNAFTIGFPTASIILHSALVENFTEGELAFVLGHELGHVKAGHNVILTFLNPLGNSIPGASLIFSFWQRKAEYTGDRCGLILHKRIEDAISGQLKLAIGLQLAKKVDLSTYKDQLINSDRKMVRMSEFLFDHPLTTNRIRKMVNFWKGSFIT